MADPVSRFSRSLLVQASPATVWQIAGREWDAIHRWFPGVTGSWMEGGAKPAVGAARVLELRDQSKMERMVERITRWEEGKGFTYAVETLPKPIKLWLNTWRFEAEGSGTRVTYDTDFQTGGGPLAPLIERLAWATQLRKTVDSLLHGLRAEAERRAAPTVKAA